MYNEDDDEELDTQELWNLPDAASNETNICIIYIYIYYVIYTAIVVYIYIYIHTAMCVYINMCV